MQSLNAVSLTQNVAAWLETTLHPRILHVFDPACNLINERKEILSIVTPQIGNGPFNLVLEAETSFSERIRTDSPIVIRRDEQVLGELTIHTRKASLWNPRPDWEYLHVQRARTVDTLFNLEKIPRPDPILLVPNYQPLVFRLCSAVANADVSLAVKAANDLAGLGAGLTPAGDDAMLGAIYAAWIIHPEELAKFLVEEIARTAAPRTTSLSAAWLKAAGRGETGGLWHQFFAALSVPGIPGTADLAGTEAAMRKILNVGETSGADALSGFLQTFRYYSEREAA